MAQIGKVKKEAIEADKEQRAKQNQGFQNWLKFKTGTNFYRMLPPQEGVDLPWIKVRKHFNLGPDENGICNCTETGKDCFICKKVRIGENSSKKKERDKAAKQKVSTGYVSQGIDVTPLYSKEKKKWVADNPPPKCWGSPKKDEDDEFIGKCQRCSWNESCDKGIQLCSMSGQRIDDIADYFDDCDLTDLKKGRNILVKRKGKGKFNTSYKVKVKKDYQWEIPKFMRKFIEENFIDLLEELAPATPEETEEAYLGGSENDDLPDCFGNFVKGKKKCKKCEYSDLCEEETDISDNDNDNDDNDNDNDDNDNDNNDNDNNDNDNDNNDNDNDNNDDDNDDDDNNDDNDDDNNDDEEENDNDNNDDDDDDKKKKKANKKKGKSIKKELKRKASKRRK